MHVQRGIAAFSRSDFWLLQEKLAMKLPSSDKSFEPRQYECPYTSDNIITVTGQCVGVVQLYTTTSW